MNRILIGLILAVMSACGQTGKISSNLDLTPEESRNSDATPICLMSKGHPENGEGEMWRIVELKNQNAQIIRSLIFYYHGIPFELDGDVATYNVSKTVVASGTLYVGQIPGEESFKLTLFKSGSALIELSKRTIEAQTPNGGGCGAIRF